MVHCRREAPLQDRMWAKCRKILVTGWAILWGICLCIVRMFLMLYGRQMWKREVRINREENYWWHNQCPGIERKLGGGNVLRFYFRWYLCAVNSSASVKIRWRSDASYYWMAVASVSDAAAVAMFFREEILRTLALSTQNVQFVNF